MPVLYLTASDVEAINAKTQSLAEASMKLGQAMYEASQKEAAEADAKADRPVEPRGAGRQAPDDDAKADQIPAREAIGEPAEQGSDDHVGEQEAVGQEPHLELGGGDVIVGQVLLANLRLDGGQYLAVDVVEQVDDEQQRQRQAGAGQRAALHYGREAARRAAGWCGHAFSFFTRTEDPSQAA